LDKCQWVRSHNSVVYDPIPNKYFEVSNILFNSESGSGEFGYWVRETIRKALFGKVVRAFVLRRRAPTSDHYSSCQWELSGAECAIKVLSWSKIQKNVQTNDTLEDPLKEIAAMQYMKRCSNTESHVLTPIEILSDSKYIFVVLPLCKDGELYDRLEQTKDCFDEGEARYWFRQIAQGVKSLHKAGVCHRDISLENVLIHGGSCHIIDMGMSLRVPQHIASTIDEQSKNILLTPQGRCGKYYYMAPEIYANREAFNPFAIDVWSTGAVLFMMLTGAPAYERPCKMDPCFQWIMSERLSELLEAWNRKLTPDAIDLLSGMLSVDPEKRLSLDQVLSHPWVVGEAKSVPPPPPAPLQ
jgi:serine/threonine protein kinase